MKGHQQQGICNANQEWEEESNNSPVIYKNIESSREDKADLEETTMSSLPQTNQSHTVETQQKLKLIVRSQYWGRELKGRTCRNVITRMNVKAPLVITSQVVLYNTDGFWGCCPNAGKRVLELQEYHFSEASEGCNWDLYLVGTLLSAGQSTHEFFLLPQNQTSVDVERNERLKGWAFYGTCTAGQIRSRIDEMLRDLLKRNDAYRHRYHHVHIDIMINKVYDKETPRSRKLNNEKTRAERKKSTDVTSGNCQRQDERQESSVTTEATASTEQESPPPAASKTNTATKPFPTKVVGAAPSIPHFVPTDPVSYLMPVSHPMANPSVDYHDTRWTGEATQWSYDQFSVPSRSGYIIGRSGQVVADNEYQGMYWHPAAERIPPPGGMPQQQLSYWNPGHGAPFVTAPPQPYGHPPDMQMHPYYQHQPMAHMGPQHSYHHCIASEVQQCHMMVPGNQHYVSVHAAAESNFGADPSIMCGEIAERGNIESLRHSFGNVSTRDDSNLSPPLAGYGSPPPAIPPTMPSLTLLNTAEISPIAAATKTQTMAPTIDSGISSPRTPSPLSDTTIGASTVHETTAPANTAELHSIPAPTTSEQVVSTASES